MSEIRVPDLPALRIFDPKATRWAVVRGLLRTALVVVSFLVIGSVLLGVGTHVLVNALDRPEQLERMMTAYRVAHPGLQVHEVGSQMGGWHQTATLTATAGGGAQQEARLSLSAFGNLDVVGVRSDPVGEVLEGLPWTRQESAAFLRRLPDGVLLDGVVVFASPRTRAQLTETDFSEGNDALLYGPAFASERGVSEPLRQFDQQPVGWPLTGGYAAPTFEDWAASLGADDDDNLRRLGLPSSERLQALAEDGRATAAYVHGRTPAQITALLDARQIVSFTPSAVRFDLSPPR